MTLQSFLTGMTDVATKTYATMKMENTSDSEASQAMYSVLADSLNVPHLYSNNELRSSFQSMNNGFPTDKVGNKHISQLRSEKRELAKQAKKASEMQKLLTPSPKRVKNTKEMPSVPQCETNESNESDSLPPPSPFAKSPIKDPKGRFYRNGLDQGGVDALLGNTENTPDLEVHHPGLKERIVDYALANTAEIGSKTVGELIRILSDNNNKAMQCTLDGYERMQENCLDISDITDTIIAMFCPPHAADI